jgi:hypothetical protein
VLQTSERGQSGSTRAPDVTARPVGIHPLTAPRGRLGSVIAQIISSHHWSNALSASCDPRELNVRLLSQVGSSVIRQYPLYLYCRGLCLSNMSEKMAPKLIPLRVASTGREVHRIGCYETSRLITLNERIILGAGRRREIERLTIDNDCKPSG